jgi:hypothetical protein
MRSARKIQTIDDAIRTAVADTVAEGQTSR